MGHNTYPLRSGGTVRGPVPYLALSLALPRADRLNDSPSLPGKGPGDRSSTDLPTTVRPVW